ncbi:MAG: cytochrome c biogenesis protein CcdA [Dehalococcoidia bacterium]|nr:cytochrome c biogenesis protein CcdA [Dehalococcoidia bacterium]
MENVSILAALGAGIVSFLSPCVLPLVPVYIAGLAGTTADGSTPSLKWFSTLPLAVAFVIGFSAVFVPLGTLAAYLGQLSFNYVDIIRKIGGGVLIVLGIRMTGLVKIPLLYREVRIDIKTGATRGIVRSSLMGMAFALGMTPCVGAVFGGILALAYGSGTVWHGAWLLGVYSLGLGLPFIAISMALTPMTKYLRAINRRLRVVSMASGFIIVALGILMVTNQLIRVTGILARL